jgi:hypothetical protein
VRPCLARLAERWHLDAAAYLNQPSRHCKHFLHVFSPRYFSTPILASLAAFGVAWLSGQTLNVPDVSGFLTELFYPPPSFHPYSHKNTRDIPIPM